MKYFHSTITVENRCLDLLLTEDEITTAFGRTLDEENIKYVDINNCCKCWPIQKPPDCPFWRKILGMCAKCDCEKKNG